MLSRAGHVAQVDAPLRCQVKVVRSLLEGVVLLHPPPQAEVVALGLHFAGLVGLDVEPPLALQRRSVCLLTHGAVAAVQTAQVGGSTFAPAVGRVGRHRGRRSSSDQERLTHFVEELMERRRAVILHTLQALLDPPERLVSRRAQGVPTQQQHINPSSVLWQTEFGCSEGIRSPRVAVRSPQNRQQLSAIPLVEDGRGVLQHRCSGPHRRQSLEQLVERLGVGVGEAAPGSLWRERCAHCACHIEV